MSAYNPWAINLNLNLNELQNAVIQKLASDPASPVEGQFWFNSTTKQLKYHDGTAVATIAEGEDLTSAITRALAAAAAGELLVSGGADRTATKYSGAAGLLKVDANGIASTASAGTDYVTAASTNTLTNKTLDANGTGNSISNIEVADFAAAALAADLSSGTSSQLAVATVIKTYVDAAVAGLGQLVGAFDASGGSLPTTGSGLAGVIEQGDYWRISVAGTIADLGYLEVGDALVASADAADEAAEFFVLQANLTDAVTSSSVSSTDNAIVRMDGENGKIAQTSLATVSDTGSVNIPAGEAYLVNNVSIMTGVAHKYAADILVADWVGASAPFTYTISAATHGLGATRDIMVAVQDSNNDVVMTGANVDASGNAVITVNSKFDARVVLLG